MATETGRRPHHGHRHLRRGRSGRRSKDYGWPPRGASLPPVMGFAGALAAEVAGALRGAGASVGVAAGLRCADGVEGGGGVGLKV